MFIISVYTQYHLHIHRVSKKTVPVLFCE